MTMLFPITNFSSLSAGFARDDSKTHAFDGKATEAAAPSWMPNVKSTNQKSAERLE